MRWYTAKALTLGLSFFTVAISPTSSGIELAAVVKPQPASESGELPTNSLHPLPPSAPSAPSVPLAPLELSTEPDPAESHIEPPPAATDFVSQQLAQLEKQLQHYQQLAQRNSWPTITKGPLLRSGDQHPQIPLIRERLLDLGDLTAAVEPQAPELDPLQNNELFDAVLEQALMRFQQRHGSKIDGIVGPQTRRQLNITPQQRADMIRLNMLRLEAFKPNTDRYILVNIPEFRLRLFEHGQPMLSMKTIVGRKKRKTPVFSTQVDRIVVNPSWHVPKSIAYKDILPGIEEDPEYLQKHNLVLVTGWGRGQKVVDIKDIDLDKLYKGKNYQRFWEPPSERNALGSVKFLTDGPHSVYLHDTSAKSLFANEQRAYSSGCIRVEQPRQLANALMRMTQGWSPDQLSPAFDNTETIQYNLTDPVPLHITYWTAWIDEQGLLNFRDDLYRHDRREIAKLKLEEQQAVQQLPTPAAPAAPPEPLVMDSSSR